MRIPNYTILTKESTLVCEDKEALAEEQDKLFFELFPNRNEEVIYHTFSNSISVEDDEEEGLAKEFDYFIQSLVLSDGVDLVRFSTGNVGFISYDGRDRDAFEIIRKESV